MKEKYVVGVYRSEDDAVSAVNRLLEMGYRHDEISVLAKDPDRFNRIESLTDVSAETPKAVARSAGAGATTGGLLGGLGGLLLSLGIIAIPGVGPILAAGPIAAMLGGAAAGGAVGGILGALAGLGFDKKEAEHYHDALERGELLVMVKADDDRYDRVSDIFRYPEDEFYRHYQRGSLDNVGTAYNAGGHRPDPDNLDTPLHQRDLDAGRTPGVGGGGRETDNASDKKYKEHGFGTDEPMRRRENEVGKTPGVGGEQGIGGNDPILPRDGNYHTTPGLGGLEPDLGADDPRRRGVNPNTPGSGEVNGYDADDPRYHRTGSVGRPPSMGGDEDGAMEEDLLDEDRDEPMEPLDTASPLDPLRNQNDINRREY